MHILGSGALVPRSANDLELPGVSLGGALSLARPPKPSGPRRGEAWRPHPASRPFWNPVRRPDKRPEAAGLARALLPPGSQSSRCRLRLRVARQAGEGMRRGDRAPQDGTASLPSAHHLDAHTGHTPHRRSRATAFSLRAGLPRGAPSSLASPRLARRCREPRPRPAEPRAQVQGTPFRRRGEDAQLRRGALAGGLIPDPSRRHPGPRGAPSPPR